MAARHEPGITGIVEKRFSRRYQVDLVLKGALVGLAGGGVVTLYRIALSHAEGLLRAVTGAIAGNVPLMALWFVVLACVMAIVAALVRWEPATSGSGIPQIDAEVIDRMDAPWHRVLAAKFAEGTLCAFAGLSLGREGPSVQLGGMAGKGVARLSHSKRGEERLLVTCGAAAGMSAAFHAPLTGVLFAIEEIHKEFTASLIISVMASSLMADYLVSGVLGVAPVLNLGFLVDFPHADYGLVVLLGVVCGLLGALHNRGMFLAQRLYGKIQAHLPLARYAIPFALAGVAAFVWPELMCGGDAIVEGSLWGAELAVLPIVAVLVGKYLFTAVCFGSGAPGGTLFPLVVMGALVGSAFALAANALLGTDLIFYRNFLALGIAGLFASVVRAPVTGIVLVFELTGSLDAMLAVSLVSILSYLVADLTRTEPFYEHLLAKQLGGSRVPEAGVSLLGRKTVSEVHVGTGCRIEGMALRDVPWPDGSRIVLIKRGADEIVPRGATVVEALDELLVIVDGGAKDDALYKIGLMTKPALEEEDRRP